MLTKEGFRSVNTTDKEPTILSCDVEGDTESIQWFKARTSSKNFRYDNEFNIFQDTSKSEMIKMIGLFSERDTLGHDTKILVQ